MFVLKGFLESFGGSKEEPRVLGQSTASGKERRGQAMIVYSPRRRVDESSLLPLGPPEDLGGEVLEGNPVLSARVDFSERGMMAGIFKATTGKLKIHFPFTEHATILDGVVTLTDEVNQTHTFKKGDSYFIRQGQTILWEVNGKHVIKSFFNITG
jgi:uncharacterized protein